MEFKGSGRFVYVAQWVLAVLLPVFFFVGRGLVGAELGWLSVIGLLFGVIMIVALLVPPVLTLFDREARAARRTRSAYALVSWSLWAALLVGALSVPDEADGGALDTALTTWTGGAIDDAASQVVFAVVGIAALLAYVGQFALGVAGVVRSRSARES